MRNSVMMSDVFPLPEAPQTASFSPGETCRFMSDRMSLLLDLEDLSAPYGYEKWFQAPCGKGMCRM
jgi:hypothetical protein